MPIYLPSTGPKATQLVGEIADGRLPIFVAPEHIGTVRSDLDEGARAAAGTRRS